MAGIYDNYITTANPNFREDWKCTGTATVDPLKY